MSILIFLLNKLLSLTFFMSVFYLVYFIFKFIMFTIKNEKMILKKNESFYLLLAVSNVMASIITGIII